MAKKNAYTNKKGSKSLELILTKIERAEEDLALLKVLMQMNMLITERKIPPLLLKSF